MNIIITGGNGFIGTSLAKRFSSKGHKVFLLDLKKKLNKTNIHKNIKFFNTDITSLNSLKKVKIPKNCVLLHCAGQPSAAVSFHKPYDDHKKNILGMMNIINFSHENKVQKIIFASTFNVYKENLRSARLKETSECEPKSLYAISKLAAENYLRVYGDYLGLKWNVLRMFNIYGPGQDRKNKNLGMISIFLNMAKNSRKVTVKGSLKRFRDFIYIEDVIEAWYKLALDKKNYNQTFNLGSGKKTTLNTLFENIQKTLKKKIYIKEVGGTPGDFLGCYANTKKIEKNLRFKAKVSLSRGLKLFNDWLDQ